MKRRTQIFAFSLAALLLSGCNAQKDVLYVQELGNNQYVKLAESTVVTMKPGDRLSVMVYCDNAVIASAFNLSSTSGGQGGSSSGGGSDESECYTVDKEGNIKLPTLGIVPVQGKTREEIAKLIEDMLVDQKLLRNPVVTVEIKGMYITVMGEVASPQRVAFNKDKMTLTEVLSECGDLGLSGERVIKVMRPEDDKMVCYTVDLRSARSLYSSPVYYMRPNDIIYVEPNKTRANETRINANSMRTPGFWISVVSLATTILLLAK